MTGLKAHVERYSEEYAAHWDIPVEHVRATVDGPDEGKVYTIRLDSYEHPGCETETIRLLSCRSPYKESN